MERHKISVLLVFLRAIVAARQRQDQWIIALQLAQFARCAGVVG
jgi:hypothetical protein